MDDSDDGPGEQEQAFYVDDLGEAEFDLDIPPTSGNEYLRRVRQEARDCPKVVVADLDTSAFLKQQTVKITEPSGLLPVPQSYRAPIAWQKLQVSEFADMRQKLINMKALIKQKKMKVPIPNLPQAKDAENWCRLCFGRLKMKTTMPGNQASGGSSHDIGEEGTPPLLHIIANMNQQQVEKVLEYHVNWLEATGFSTRQGRWFYALLANLQKPLTPEMCAWLRRLARLCSNIRASLESPEDPKLKELNLIICLVSRYFEQRDLADSS